MILLYLQWFKSISQTPNRQDQPDALSQEHKRGFSQAGISAKVLKLNI